MLPAFAHISLSTGYILAGLFSCEPSTAPAITVQFQNNPPQISNTRSSTYLLNLKKDSSSPNYGREFPNLDGLTSGVFQFKFDLDFTNTEQMMLHTACVQTKAVSVVITYTPTVYISSSAAPGSCRYAATMEHEMRHVSTDIDTINEFIPRIKTLAKAALASTAHPKPINENEEESAQNDVSEQLSQVLEEETNAIQKARKSRQALVDTRAEYERLSRACPNEQPR